MVGLKEATQFKQYLLNNSEAKNREIVIVFMRTGSIFNFRSEMRGYLGLPRMRSNDSLHGNGGSRRSGSPDSSSPLFRKKFSLQLRNQSGNQHDGLDANAGA